MWCNISIICLIRRQNQWILCRWFRNFRSWMARVKQEPTNENVVVPLWNYFCESGKIPLFNLASSIWRFNFVPGLHLLDLNRIRLKIWTFCNIAYTETFSLVRSFSKSRKSCWQVSRCYFIRKWWDHTCILDSFGVFRWHRQANYETNYNGCAPYLPTYRVAPGNIWTRLSRFWQRSSITNWTL